jgi:hypothetical protein
MKARGMAIKNSRGIVTRLNVRRENKDGTKGFVFVKLEPQLRQGGRSPLRRTMIVPRARLGIIIVDFGRGKDTCRVWWRGGTFLFSGFP